jgi:hypothetical protein
MKYFKSYTGDLLLDNTKILLDKYESICGENYDHKMSIEDLVTVISFARSRSKKKGDRFVQRMISVVHESEWFMFGGSGNLNNPCLKRALFWTDWYVEEAAKGTEYRVTEEGNVLRSLMEKSPHSGGDEGLVFGTFCSLIASAYNSNIEGMMYPSILSFSRLLALACCGTKYYEIVRKAIISEFPFSQEMSSIEDVLKIEGHVRS